ncbi:MAG: hypothetical protein V5A61_15920 [Haloarculaceae archaeon]
MHDGMLTRRTILRLAAASGAVGLAGCTGRSGDDGSGDGGSGDGGTPSLEPDDEKIHCGSGTDLSPPAMTVGDVPAVPAVRSPGADRGDAPSPSVSATQAPGGVPIEEVSIELHRRAARLIERVRGTDAAPGWEAARLRDVAYPYRRPDLDGVAYYEFGVDPEGFIVLSTDVHGFPVAHWNPVGPSPSRRLEARARESGGSVSRRYKLDTLAYAAENEAGERVAAVGPPVYRIVGMRREWLDAEPPVSRTFVAPREAVRSDAEVDEELEYAIEHSGPEVAVEFEPWASWEELKAGYAESYGVLNAAISRAARKEWAVHRQRAERGIEIDSPYRLALLFPDTQYDVRGEGAEFVRVEVLDRGELPPVLEIVPTSDLAEPVPFAVELFYPDGRREVVRFLVTGSSAGNRLVDVGVAEALSDALGLGLTDHLPGFCLAGFPAHQRLYDPNSSGSCTAGAGAVAWALLYGWADYQACLDEAPWTPRWGLYRKNGGEAPVADEFAPRTPSSGTDSMLDELQDLTGYCSDGTGVTRPDDMKGQVGKYVVGRSGAAVDARTTPVLPKRRLNEIAAQSICEHDTPAVIGSGAEYVLAWKYRQGDPETEFYVNRGEGNAGDGWVPAKKTFYVGVVCPSAAACTQVTA